MMEFELGDLVAVKYHGYHKTYNRSQRYAFWRYGIIIEIPHYNVVSVKFSDIIVSFNVYCNGDRVEKVA